MSYLSDKQIASILRNGQYPQGDLIGWNDSDKNEFMSDVMGKISPPDIAEIWSEVSCDMRQGVAGSLFTDPLSFAADFGGSVYLYLESQLRDQVISARNLIEQEAA